MSEHFQRYGSNNSRSSPLGVFEFVIALVLISTIGKVLSDRTGRPDRDSRRELRRGSPHGGREEGEGVREALNDLSSRLERLEEERDFYKDLLEAPQEKRKLRSAEGSSIPSDPPGPA